MYNMILLVLLAGNPDPLVFDSKHNPYSSKEACEAEVLTQDTKTEEALSANGSKRGKDFEFLIKCVPAEPRESI